MRSAKIWLIAFIPAILSFVIGVCLQRIVSFLRKSNAIVESVDLTNIAVVFTTLLLATGGPYILIDKKKVRKEYSKPFYYPSNNSFSYFLGLGRDFGIRYN